MKIYVLRHEQRGESPLPLSPLTHIGFQNSLRLIPKINDIKPDIIVFLDGDYSDFPEELVKLVEPIITDNYDFVIGARVKELREKGSMTFPQIFGNWLSTFLMTLIYGAKFSDLGPFRAIRYDKLLELDMKDKTYGWTVEMQLKALSYKLKYKEKLQFF